MIPPKSPFVLFIDANQRDQQTLGSKQLAQGILDYLILKAFIFKK